MKRIMHACAAIALVATVAVADQGGGTPVRESRSPNGRFQLQIRAGRPGENAIRGCKAGLYERSGSRSHSRPRWERFLVNDVAPERVFIRDDGRFVITLDEYGRGGARNALVIYGERGELLRHFLLSDLLDRSGWADVRKDGNALNWLEGANFQFVESPPMFLITLRRGREVGVDLQRLQVIREGGAVSGINAIPAVYLDTLFDFAAGYEFQTAIDDGASSRERTALSGEPGAHEAESDEDSDAQLSDATELSAESERFVEQSEPALLEGEEAADIVPGESAPSQFEADAASLAEEMGGSESASPAEGAVLGVPLPDPAAPVDYLAWANARTATAGPSALPDYQAAADETTRWTGDTELLKAALAGDAAALASPEIQAWVATNRDGWERFRDGFGKEYNGWPLVSKDGSLLGATLPALQPMRELSGVAVIQGRQYAAAGLPGSAADSYFDALTAGAVAGSGPTLIESLVGTAMQNTAATAVLDLQAGAAAGQLDYPALAARLDESYYTPRTLAETLQFEEATFMDTVQRTFAYDAQSGEYVVDPAKAAVVAALFDPNPDPDKIASVTSRIAEIGFEQTVAQGTEYHKTVAEAVSHPYAEAQRGLEAAERIFDTGQASPLLTPAALSRYHQLRTKAGALQNATRLVTQLNAYRQEYGTYPDSLEAFGGADFVVDPFTGTGLNYQRTGETFRLYSVGVNGVDDGGASGDSDDAGDIVYWPRPSAAAGR